MLRSLAIRCGLWLLRLGGLYEPAYDRRLLDAALEQCQIWESAIPAPCQGEARRRKVLMNLRSEFPAVSGRELSFAVERALHMKG